MCFYLGLLPNTPLVRKLGQNRPGSRGGGGEHSHIKMTGCSSEILKRNLKRYQDPVLWEWHEFVFTPKRYQIMGFNETKLKIIIG